MQQSHWLNTLRGKLDRMKHDRRGVRRTLTVECGVECLEDRSLLSALTHTLLDPTGNAWGYGQSVATNGTWTVVGSPHATSGGVGDAGRAYLYDSSGALWCMLENPFPNSGDQFGYSVAVSGNLVAVGAYADDGGVGAVHIFDAFTGGNNITISNPTGLSGEEFGVTVGLSGHNLLVGATWAAGNVGTAYIFDTTTGGLGPTLSNPNPSPHDRYGGTGVAISGNLAVVGSYGEDTGGADAGAAYLFNVTTGAVMASLFRTRAKSISRNWPME